MINELDCLVSFILAMAFIAQRLFVQKKCNVIIYYLV